MGLALSPQGAPPHRRQFSVFLFFVNAAEDLAFLGAQISFDKEIIWRRDTRLRAIKLVAWALLFTWTR